MIKIIVDSASDISQNEAKQLGITVLPMTVSFGEQDFLDGINLSHNEFYEKLIENTDFPKTSQVNAYAFEEEYKKLTANGDQVLVITVSSKLSGTYNSALQASKDYVNQVFVVDSLNVAIAERLLVSYALQLIKNNKSITEIVDMLNEKKTKINLMAMLNTLEYLKKGGRISAAVAFAGKLLSIKPVISVVDGEVKLVGKALGSKNASNLLNKLVLEKGGIDFTMPYGVIWSGLDDTLLKKYVMDSSHLWQNEVDNMPAYSIGATIGTHVGPGAIGVAFFQK